jgi:hypothetical protein
VVLAQFPQQGKTRGPGAVDQRSGALTFDLAGADRGGENPDQEPSAENQEAGDDPFEDVDGAGYGVRTERNKDEDAANDRTGSIGKEHAHCLVHRGMAPLFLVDCAQDEGGHFDHGPYEE